MARAVDCRQVSELLSGWIFGFVGIYGGQSLTSTGFTGVCIVEKRWESQIMQQ